MIKTWLKRGGAHLVLAIGMLTVGCSNTITESSVSANMSPEMKTIAHTHEQRCNYIARSLDTTQRQIFEDWDRFWLIEEPLHLSKYPIP